MHIHEYQAKKILKKYNVRVQDGVLVSSKKSIKSSLEKIKSFPVFIKAQVHAGGRKKSGAVQQAVSHKDAEQKLSEIIGMKIVNNQTGPEGRKVMKAYIEGAIIIKSEFYISLIINRSLAKPMFIVSKSGGTEIETLAKTDPDKIIKVPIDICIGIQDFHIRKILYVLNLDENHFNELKNLIHGIYNAFMENDADQIEINPVALDNENKLIALDAKMNFDENAYYRQQAIFKLKDKSGYSQSEKLAEKYNLSFIKMDGSIGCVTNGAGLAMATMDIIKHFGGSPANFLDIGGEVNAETASRAFEIISLSPNVKVIFVNIFGGIVNSEIIADGIITLLQRVKKVPPIVLRLLGMNAESAKNKLKNINCEVVFVEDLKEASKLAVDYAMNVR